MQHALPHATHRFTTAECVAQPGPKLCHGLSCPIQFNCVAEVPAFYFQARWLRVLSPNAVLHLAMGTMVLRLLAYAFLPALPGCPWSVLPVELLQGVTFGMSWGVCTTQCKAIAPEALQATVQVR